MVLYGKSGEFVDNYSLSETQCVLWGKVFFFYHLKNKELPKTPTLDKLERGETHQFTR